MENSETTDSGRKVVGALVGIVLIVILIMVARWTGDQIRDRLVKPKPVAVEPVIPARPAEPVASTATYSAIPSTGPNDWLYAVAGIMIVSGAGLLKLSRKADY